LVSPPIHPDTSPSGELGSPCLESPAPAFDEAQQLAPIVPTILNEGHGKVIRGDEYEHENPGLPRSRSPSPDQEDDSEEPLADGGVMGGLGALDPTAVSKETLHALRNLIKGPYPTLSNKERVSLTLYLDCNGTSQDVHKAVRHTFETEHPDAYPSGLLSHY
jgi:hypothetical protein